MLYASEHMKICDFHVHVGEKIGGLQLAQGFKELSKMAESKGIAAIGAFVTEEPGQSLTKKYFAMKEAASRYFEGFVHWHLTPVTAGFEEVSRLLEDGCDLKFYTTYREAGLYCTYQNLERWMLAFPQTRFLVHCEDDAIVSQSRMQHRFTHPYHHCQRRPELAEIRAVGQVLELSAKHNHPLHIVHVSSPKAALMIQEAKQDSDHVTCETAPHYLIYNEDRLKEKHGHRYICSPPYRSEASRGMLAELLQESIFDILASDHCPFSNQDKDRYVDRLELVPNGIPGLATLFSSIDENFVQTGKIKLEKLIDLTCVKPAKLMNFKG